MNAAWDLAPADGDAWTLAESVVEAAEEAVQLAIETHGATSEEAIGAQHAVEHVLRALLHAEATPAETIIRAAAALR